MFLVTDPKASPGDLRRVLPFAIRGGASHVLLRMPEASAAELYRVGLDVRSMLNTWKTPLLISDRIDVALGLRATGIQLGERSLPVSVARRLVPDRLVGMSVHSREQATTAVRRGADYV